MTYLLIILIILNLFNIFISIYLLFMLKKKVEIQKDSSKLLKKSLTFNEDKYLNSLDFNRLLDDKIVPLLGKYSNSEIVQKVFSDLIMNDPNSSKIDKKKLYDYIKFSLENYSNRYNELLFTEDLEEPKREEVYYDPAREFSSKLNKQMDITNTLKNFYK